MRSKLVFCTIFDFIYEGAKKLKLIARKLLPDLQLRFFEICAG